MVAAEPFGAQTGDAAKGEITQSDEYKGQNPNGSVARRVQLAPIA
jgi:hypothetical protein